MNAGLVEEDTLDGTHKLMQNWLDLSEGERALIVKNTVTCYKEKFYIGQAAKNLINVIRSSSSRSGTF